MWSTTNAIHMQLQTVWSALTKTKTKIGKNEKMILLTETKTCQKRKLNWNEKMWNENKARTDKYRTEF